jgi:hypothetical protein
MGLGKQTSQELGKEALVSVPSGAFRLILATPRKQLVETLNQMLKKGTLIIWNPFDQELLKSGDIVKATVSGNTIRISVAHKEQLSLREWFYS